MEEFLIGLVVGILLGAAESHFGLLKAILWYIGIGRGE